MSAVIALELRYLQKQNSFKQLHLIMLKKYKKVLSIYESISFLSVFHLCFPSQRSVKQKKKTTYY